MYWYSGSKQKAQMAFEDRINNKGGSFNIP